jgi:predicted nucleic acid-binding protein
MILYLDTSALIKRYIHENYSDEFISLVEGSDALGTSVITRVEMASAMSKSIRLGLVIEQVIAQSWQDFLEQWPAFIRLNITSGLLDRAAELVWEHGLRGYDAIHLSSAIIWQDALGMPLLLATFDRNLWTAGAKTGIRVWPEGPYT